MSTSLALPACRQHITQKVRIAGQRTLYLSIHDDEHPAEIFLRLKGADCSSELIGLYDVIARLMSLALQYGAPFEKVGDLLTDAKFAPCGHVTKAVVANRRVDPLGGSGHGRQTSTNLEVRRDKSERRDGSITCQSEVGQK